MAVTIALDGRTIYSATRRGTGKNLLDAYRALASLRTDWKFIIYHRGEIGHDPFASRINVAPRRIEMRGDRWDWWEQIRLPAAAWRDGADLLHCPANSCPRWSRVPVVSTIHDLIPLRISDAAVNGHADRFRRSIQRCLKKSAQIITVSRSTRDDLISDFGADPQRLDVITWAADSAYAPVRDESELARVWSRYNITGRYLLAFSGRSRRKNAAGMIHGFSRLSEALRRDVQFIVIGVEPADQRAWLMTLIEELGLLGRCMIFGFAPEEDVPALLSGAEALAFCSLYEGFGLPILDAFCCRTPVLTSGVSSMPEVAGDAAVYCNPNDPDSIANGMHRILSDEALRQSLIEKGPERAKQFTWPRTAEAICGVFEKCLRNHPTQRAQRLQRRSCG